VKPIRLLLVDDVAEMRELMRFGLSRPGEIEIVGEAADGLQAIDRAGTLRPDVTILDVAMPRLDGINAIPGIHDANPGGHIVMLTGFDSEEMETKALSACASAFIQKGTPADTIAEVVMATAALPPKVRCGPLGAEAR
jgi:DNA-binding NarL/FixJ family response regulator